ncbi:pentapeptide repeat-containing protein [Spirillospora sp. NPDC048823]|uniref:pentapeptide repeat-containing protein n=1 Tax=unclassified Spirillospora TaxID=2642701 RepID=UPI00371BAD54
MLAFRRQGHQEYDTAERRVTELYNAAAEQLGSDKAPVRLTALYTLERLADNNPAHRQTIVNIICAYLRMPYTPPETSAADPDRAAREQVRRHAARYRAARAGQPIPAAQAGPNPDEEHQVRLTAQALLSAHLHPSAQVYWPNLSLDLTGATLANALNLTGCRIRDAVFRRATFIHGAFFARTTVTGSANFVGAVFTGSTKFDNAAFAGVAYFRAATFSSSASFLGAAFAGHVHFGEIKGEGGICLENATVADAGMEHVLPPGWRVESAAGTAGHIVLDSAPAGEG